MRDINLPFSEELKITTYSHFVQSELIKYWPIVVKNCNQIKKDQNGLKIKFLLMNKVIF